VVNGYRISSIYKLFSGGLIVNNHIITVTNWREALNKAKADPAVGIRIAPLTQNETFGMYVTEILPNKKVTAHYHQEGIEIYSILAGNGMLYTASPNRQNEPTYIQEKAVKTGDFFNIEPGVIHQLVNLGQDPLILVFGCPGSHLSSDRVITKDLFIEE
jgi:quercetin dioxygenase-like cupin family protein